MNKRYLKAALFAVVAAVAGYGAYQALAQENDLSEIALANVEALATYEVDRQDCEPARDNDCAMFVIYADGNWGLDVLKNHKKKAGWG